MSLHMSGGTTGGGWGLSAIGWVSLFVGSGAAVHATYWRTNNFGEPISNGCADPTCPCRQGIPMPGIPMQLAPIKNLCP